MNDMNMINSAKFVIVAGLLAKILVYIHHQYTIYQGADNIDSVPLHTKLVLWFVVIAGIALFLYFFMSWAREKWERFRGPVQ